MKDFNITRKIYYHHTDAGGVVYYAKYLEFFEEGRTEYLLKNGIDTARYAENGVMFPVVRVEIDYKKPARYGEEIFVFTRVEKVGAASIQFTQEIKKGDAVLVFTKAILACVNADFKVRPVPPEIKRALGGN